MKLLFSIYLERCSRDEGLAALIASVIVSRSSALSYFRANDRLIIIIAITVDKDPRNLLFPVLLLHIHCIRYRSLLPFVRLDRVAQPADGM